MTKTTIIDFNKKYKGYDNESIVKCYLEQQDLEAGYFAQSNPSFDMKFYEYMKLEEKYLKNEIDNRKISKETVNAIKEEMEDEFINKF